MDKTKRLEGGQKTPKIHKEKFENKSDYKKSRITKKVFKMLSRIATVEVT